MKNIKLFALIAVVFSLNACKTIYFEKGTMQNPVSNEVTWHHGGGILGLFEFSSPYNPKQKCDGKNWEAVKTDQTFATGLVGGLVPYGIYRPWGVAVRCAN